MATVFVSPGVYTREQDFSVFASSIGITRLGLVGLTTKGPAFEPIKIKTAPEFLLRFGTTKSEYQLPYVANSFLQQSGELTVTRVLGQEGFTNSNAWLITATSGGTGSTGVVIAVLRSKSADDGVTFKLTAESNLRIGNVSTLLGTFTLSAATGSFSAITNGVTVSLDETREDYIVNVIGKDPINGDYDIYVESIYPHYIREANKRGQITTLYSGLTFASQTAWTDYADIYSNSITPWIVSRVVGGEAKNLFKVHTISDGDASSKEIKISISNLDEINKTFDLLVRNYSDTDATASQTALERFRGITVDPTKSNFIGRQIGTLDEEYPRKSNFILIEMATNALKDTIPCGFKGYSLRDSAISGNTAPNIFYKSVYFSGDSVTKTYLGVSELGYTGHTADQVAYTKVIKTIEDDLFVYYGAAPTGLTSTKGFHMESTAPTADYVVGQYNSVTGYTKSQRKFTIVPAGGFDGFNKFRVPSFTTNARDVSNVASIKEAVVTMANPEEVDINLFAMPGIEYKNNEDVVKYALEIMEDRADTLYIMDSPRVTEGTTKGTPDEVVISLQETGIDSNYASTYWPWIQINDANTNKFVYISPTSEVVRSIALTDNVAYPWFAPAGINRGTVSGNVVRADIKLSKEDRDVLYDGRVNPIATFVQQGVVIFGQKTLQVRQSALDRINIRRLLLQVRRLIAAASQTLLFEQNDQALRDQFLSKVEPILLQIQNQRGLTAFKVIMDASNNTADVIDRNTLVGKIMLKPTPTAEFIELSFSVLNSGANFSDF